MDARKTKQCFIFRHNWAEEQVIIASTFMENRIKILILRKSLLDLSLSPSCKMGTDPFRNYESWCIKRISHGPILHIFDPRNIPTYGLGLVEAFVSSAAVAFQKNHCLDDTDVLHFPRPPPTRDWFPGIRKEPCIHI